LWVGPCVKGVDGILQNLGPLGHGPVILINPQGETVHPVVQDANVNSYAQKREHDGQCNPLFHKSFPATYFFLFRFYRKSGHYLFQTGFTQIKLQQQSIVLTAVTTLYLCMKTRKIRMFVVGGDEDFHALTAPVTQDVLDLRILVPT
jgi:hypothetical protein